MATLNLRRFSKPETLLAIAREHLIAFLEPYRAYFLSRGVPVPLPGTEAPLDYGALSLALLSPDANMPKELIDALFFVNELAMPESFDTLHDAIVESGLPIDIVEETSPTDLAIQIWMKRPALLERLHSEHFLSKPRKIGRAHV